MKLQGFKTVVQENVVLTVGQSVNLVTRMEVSTVAETVTVSARPTVETTRSAVANTLDQRTVENTPILGRKFEDLLTLTPGVSVVQGPDGDEITFAGQRGIFNNISLDGGDYNNGFFGEQAGGQRAAVDITLEAVKEFQVIASGAPAEFGRTAGGVVNVVTKSGTNELHGNLFYFQRARRPDRRAVGRHVARQIPSRAVRRHDGRSASARSSCSTSRPSKASPATSSARTCRAPSARRARCRRRTSGRDEALINGSPDCQRLALLTFISTRAGQDESLPIEHPITTAAILLKTDAVLNLANRLAVSYNFNHSRKENETFDVATYGTSANGIEGDPARIHVINANWFTTLLELDAQRVPLHLLARESRRARPSTRTCSSDTGIGFGPTFRFGNPFFLQPGVDEHLWRVQLKNNLSWVKGRHTMKVGGEWLHTMNDQVFRGFFTGRYLFDSVAGFLRYASPAAAGGFGPSTVGCSNGTLRDGAGGVSRGQHADRRAAALLSAGRGPRRPGHRRGGRVAHHERRVLAVRAGSVADASEPDAQLRPALGRAGDAGDRRSAHDGLRARS